MADRVTLLVPVYMKIWGQPMIVYGGSTVDVASSSMFAPSQITNVVAGGGTLLNGTHNQPVSGSRIKE
jgi:hypothetical protein